MKIEQIDVTIASSSLMHREFTQTGIEIWHCPFCNFNGTWEATINHTMLKHPEKIEKFIKGIKNGME
jgi:hypothetical protein